MQDNVVNHVVLVPGSVEAERAAQGVQQSRQPAAGVVAHLDVLLQPLPGGDGSNLTVTKCIEGKKKTRKSALWSFTGQESLTGPMTVENNLIAVIFLNIAITAILRKIWKHKRLSPCVLCPHSSSQ